MRTIFIALIVLLALLPLLEAKYRTKCDRRQNKKCTRCRGPPSNPPTPPPCPNCGDHVLPPPEFKKGGRITQGFEAANFLNPFITRLNFTVGGEERQCGGTIISCRHILTSRHCIDEALKTSPIAPSLTATFAEVDTQIVDTGEYSVSVLLVANVSYRYPPGPPAHGFDDDIALITLPDADRIVTSDNIKPICIPPQCDDPEVRDPPCETNRYVTIYGWGQEMYSGGTNQTKLQYIGIPILPISSCAATLGGAGIAATPGMMCAGENAHDACQGDSGGPLIGTNYAATHHTLCGVISFGRFCGWGQYRSIYANVCHYSDWLNSFISTEL